MPSGPGVVWRSGRLDRSNSSPIVASFNAPICLSFSLDSTQCHSSKIVAVSEVIPGFRLLFVLVPVSMEWRNSFRFLSSTLYCLLRPPSLILDFPCLYPLHLFPGMGALFFLSSSTCTASLLLTCPYHFSLFSGNFFAADTILLILSRVHFWYDLSSRLIVWDVSNIAFSNGGRAEGNRYSNGFHQFCQQGSKDQG